jgi:hypothetical protein
MPTPAPAEILYESFAGSVEVAVAEDFESSIVVAGEDVVDAPVPVEAVELADLLESLASVDDGSTLNHLGAFVLAATVICVTPPSSGST